MFINVTLYIETFISLSLSLSLSLYTQPENIVLKDKDAKQLVIIDFGTAQDLSANPKAKAMVGTPEFIGE